jgi:opacity protein-like surface antigen
MHKASLLFCAATLACSVSVSAHAQATTPESTFSRVMSRVDLGVSGAGMFTGTVSGPVVSSAAPDYYNCPTPTTCTVSTLQDKTSNTLGAVVNIRYQQKPWLGFELNVSYARYTENYTDNTTQVGSPFPFQVQTRASEYSFGYLAQPAFTVFGLRPFFGVGAGGLEFKPTGHGGEGQQSQIRPAEYYTVGVQKDINSFLGVRAGIRQVFFAAPDFYANYLNNGKYTSTLEPNAGFYIKF